ncbi:MAG: hypothetical protein E7I07_18460 [Enterobacter asburiae]|nr:hypothetical protein [Enterobacter asburiae]
MSIYYDLPEDQKTITKNDLTTRPTEFQIEVMRTWFFQRYQDPVHECPYISDEGGYLFIYGGPYDAREELFGEFTNIIPDEVIEMLADELDNEGIEWSGISKPEDFDDDYFFDTSGSTIDPYKDFLGSINNLRAMMSLNIHDETQKHTYLTMLFINSITIMEVFLSEYFIGRIETDKYYLRRFIETNKDFTKEKFSLSEIFSKMDEIEKYAKEYLMGLLWHNLPKIRAIYKHSLNIEFPESLENLIKATHIRHDLVHRAGKTSEGKKISLCMNDIDVLLDELEAFASHIEKNNFPEF